MPEKSRTLSYIIYYVFPLRTVNLIIDLLLLNLGTVSNFFRSVFFSFSFTSILGAFTHQSQIQ